MYVILIFQHLLCMTLRIQRRWRALKIRLAFLKQKSAAVKIQRCWRARRFLVWMSEAAYLQTCHRAQTMIAVRQQI